MRPSPDGLEDRGRILWNLRRSLAGQADLSRPLDESEKEKEHDAQFNVVFDSIRELMAPPEKARRSIGIRAEEAGLAYGVRRRGSAATGWGAD